MRRGGSVGLSHNLKVKVGLRLYIGNKNAQLPSLVGLVGSHSASWKYQMPAFSTTRTSSIDPAPGPAAPLASPNQEPGGCEPPQRQKREGHPSYETRCNKGKRRGFLGLLLRQEPKEKERNEPERGAVDAHRDFSQIIFWGSSAFQLCPSISQCLKTTSGTSSCKAD
jgi:hypothetical protein